jgi:hypothetical protein
MRATSEASICWKTVVAAAPPRKLTTVAMIKTTVQTAPHPVSSDRSTFLAPPRLETSH